jgi:hypothetical protein
LPHEPRAGCDGYGSEPGGCDPAVRRSAFGATSLFTTASAKVGSPPRTAVHPGRPERRVWGRFQPFAGARWNRSLDRASGCRSALSRICASTRREGAGAPLVPPPAGDGHGSPQPRSCTPTGPPPDHGVTGSLRSPCPSGDGRPAEPHPVQRLQNRCSGNPLPSADNDVPVLRSAASPPPRAPSDRRPRRRRRAVLPPGP